MTRWRTALLSLTALLCAGPGVAQVLQFEGVVGPGGATTFNSNYVEDNFRILNPSGTFFILGDPFPGLNISNGTDVGFVQNQPIFDIVYQGFQTFALRSFDAGQGFSAPAGTLTITGTQTSGQVVTATFATPSNALSSFNLPATFTDLVSVRFSSTSNFLTVDNIDLALVPLPVQVRNGGFETGDTSGWRPTNTGNGDWRAYTASTSPNGLTLGPAPEGIFAAGTSGIDDGSHLLYQDVQLAVDCPTIQISATIYYENTSGTFVDNGDLGIAMPNQQFRIDVMDPNAAVDDVGAGVLVNVFQTVQGVDPLVLGPTQVTADLSAFAGQAVRIRLAEVSTEGVFAVAVDDVRLDYGASSDEAGLVNGGFETGSFCGWSVDESGSGMTLIYQTGLSELPLSGPVLACGMAGNETCGPVLSDPPEGMFASVSDQTGPSYHILYQDLTIPSAGFVLEADIYYEDFAGAFNPTGNVDNISSGSNHQIRMDIVDPVAPLGDVGTGVILPIFRTDPGDTPVLMPTTVSANLGSLAGRTVRVRFSTTVTDYFMHGYLDNVRFTSTDLVPENVQVSDDQIQVGDFVDVDGQVRNVGTAAGSSDILYQISPDPYFTLDDPILLVDIVPTVPPGAVATLATRSLQIVVPPGDYYIGVCAFEPDRESRNNCDYEGPITVALPAEDAYEQNDTRLTAYDLNANEGIFLSAIFGNGVAYDDDWYQFTIDEPRLLVDLNFNPALGDLDLELYDSGGALVASSAGGGPTEVIDLPGAPPGTYFTRVFGATGGVVYDLRWEDRAAPQVVIFDFESGTQGFLVGPADGVAPGMINWNRTSACESPSGAHSTPNSFYFGDAGGIATPCTFETFIRESGTLTSPSLTVSGRTLLRFNQFLVTEGGGFFDAAQVLTSTDGVNFDLVATNEFDGALSPELFQWREISIPLGQVTGPLFIQYRFDTLDSIFNGFPGWYVDDVQVISDNVALTTRSPGQGAFDSLFASGFE